MRIAVAVWTSSALAVLLTACGGSGATEPGPASESGSATSEATEQPAETPGPSEQPPSTEPAGPVVQVQIAGDSVAPMGERIDAKVGEPVTFIVTSDRTGGLHVHSSPEQSPEFRRGQTTIEVTITKPGVVDVEEHESGALVVQLEVR